MFVSPAQASRKAGRLATVPSATTRLRLLTPKLQKFPNLAL